MSGRPVRTTRASVETSGRPTDGFNAQRIRWVGFEGPPPPPSPPPPPPTPPHTHNPPAPAARRRSVRPGGGLRGGPGRPASEHDTGEDVAGGCRGRREPGRAAVVGESEVGVGGGGGGGGGGDRRARSNGVCWRAGFCAATPVYTLARSARSGVGVLFVRIHGAGGGGRGGGVGLGGCGWRGWRAKWECTTARRRGF